MKKATTVLITVAAMAATLFALSTTADAAITCNYVASPTGSDAANGSVSAPFQTVQKLADSLAPGQVGCLRAGAYSGDVEVSDGGQAGAPVTLTSYPGESAAVTGRLWIASGADYVTVTGLSLNGVNSDNLPSPTINAAHATFSNDEVTDDHTGICFAVGSGWGHATDTLITRDRIHDCGVLPAANHDHGIYVANATGTRIEWNLIYDNADRGIQMYPNAQDTTIDHNVVDGNGEGIIFSGANGTASDNTDVYDNLVTGSVLRHDVESWYPSGNPVGTGNSFHNNCVWGGAEGTIQTSGGGFTADHNTVANPEYVDAAAHDYLLKAGSRCMAITGNIAAAVEDGGTVQPSVRAHAATSRRCPAHARRCTSHRRARR